MKVIVNRSNYVVIPVLLTFLGIARMDIIFHKFIKHPSKKTGTFFEELNEVSRGQCFGFCTARVGCSSLAFSNTGGICLLSKDRHLTSHTTLASGWNVFGVMGEFLWGLYLLSVLALLSWIMYIYI